MTGGTRSYEMARRLVKMGHDVDMITSWRDPSVHTDWFITVESGITVHWLPVLYSNHMSYKDRIRSFFKFAFRAAIKAAKLSAQADIIFATSTPLTIILPGFYASRRNGIPLVFEVRDLWPELPIAMGALRNPVARSAARLLENLAYRSSAHIIALSPGMVDGIVKTGIPTSCITEISNSSDLEVFRPDLLSRKSFREQLCIKNDQILVVYAGTFGRINGVDYLVKLAAQLSNDDRFYFLLLGDGYEYSKIVNLAKSLGVLNSNLSIMPSVPKSEMPKVLAAADIATSLFIPLKAMESNSANKFFDGLASGSCMAINYGGWQADLLSKSGAGIQLSTDINLAAQQFCELADNSDRILQAKTAARRLAVQCFARDKLAHKFEHVLLRSIRKFN